MTTYPASPSEPSTTTSTGETIDFDLSTYQDANTIRHVLLGLHTVAIVGLSPNVLRSSHFVGFYLQRHGYRIVPVNPREDEILGEKSYPSLGDIPFPVDVVDVFRQPSAVPPIASEAASIGAKVLWLQYGVVSREGAETARDDGLIVVMDRCMKVEHARHLGRMHWLGFNTDQITARRRPLD
jgi:predicted CoA-binding protein